MVTKAIKFPRQHGDNCAIYGHADLLSQQFSAISLDGSPRRREFAQSLAVVHHPVVDETKVRDGSVYSLRMTICSPKNS